MVPSGRETRRRRSGKATAHRDGTSAAPRGFFPDPRARFYSAHGKQFCPIINRAIVGGWLYARGAFHTSECNGNQIERRRARGLYRPVLKPGKYHAIYPKYIYRAGIYIYIAARKILADPSLALVIFSISSLSNNVTLDFRYAFSFSRRLRASASPLAFTVHQRGISFPLFFLFFFRAAWRAVLR